MLSTLAGSFEFLFLLWTKIWKKFDFWLYKLGNQHASVLNCMSVIIIPILVGSLASEFLGWSWETHVGIPMLDIGIPTSEFQCPT